MITACLILLIVAGFIIMIDADQVDAKAAFWVRFILGLACIVCAIIALCTR